jgi:hypothetical protein
LSIAEQLEQKFGRILQFEESSHSYFLPGKRTISVTQLIKAYTSPFDSETHSARVANRLGVTSGEILKDWEETAKVSTDIGSSVHEFFYELIFKKNTKWEETLEKYDSTHPDYQQRTPLLYCEILRFWSDFKHIYEPIAGETAIVDFDTGLCGTFDLLFRNKQSGKLELFDIKTNKKFTDSNKYGETLLPPLDHLDNCEVNKYSLQMSLYKHILEKELGLSISEMNVLWLEDTYHIIPLKDLRLECEQMLADYMVKRGTQDVDQSHQV